MSRRIEIGSVDIDAIKDQYPLAEVVGRHVVLKRRGHQLIGLCPFHDERTPSFTVYPQDQRYHCYGCAAHGDIFDFLLALDGLDIRAAAEQLTGGTFPVMSADRVAELQSRQARFEAEQAEKREVAMRQARERWIAADPTYSSHPYLEAKGIKLASGAKVVASLTTAAATPSGPKRSMTPWSPRFHRKRPMANAGRTNTKL